MAAVTSHFTGLPVTMIFFHFWPSDWDFGPIWTKFNGMTTEPLLILSDDSYNCFPIILLTNEETRHQK